MFLYFIILHEFYYKKYLEIRGYKYRVEHLKYIYTVEIPNYAISPNDEHSNKKEFKKESNYYFKEYEGILKHDYEYFIKNIFLFKDMMKRLQTHDKSLNLYIKYICTFLSCVGDENIDEHETNLTERYVKAGITVDFWEYIKNNYEDLKEENYSNNYPFTKLFKMVETLP